jgi:hypothetical protein
MHNLTYTERARNAYAEGNIELSDALEICADFERVTENLDNLNADMLDVLYEVLPYIETVAEEDEGYKAGAVAKVLRNIQAVIKQVEES